MNISIKFYYNARQTSFLILTVALICLFFSGYPLGRVFASDSNGTISSSQSSAWGSNLGWINFACDNCNVHVTDTALTGYAWSRDLGWINLSPAGGGVTNNCLGQLGGYAWSSHLGYINFSGTSIDSSGKFTGMAASLTDKSGNINFSCDNCDVQTDWRQCSLQVSPQSGGGNVVPQSGGGGGGNILLIPSNSNKAASPSNNQPSSTTINANSISQIASQLSTLTQQINKLFASQHTVSPISYPPIAQSVPQQPQPVFQNNWQILPAIPSPNLSFVNNATPENIQDLSGKFSQLSNTFKSLGMGSSIDAKKLTNATFILPTIADALGSSLAKGSSAFQGVALSQLSDNAKAVIPTDIVFARTPDEKIDYGINLSVAANGNVQQKMETTVNKVIELVIKPAKPVTGIQGYLVLVKTNATPVASNNLMDSFFASLIGKGPQVIPASNTSSQGAIVSQFQYANTNGDGIYTSQIETPSIDGQYKIVTVLNYKDTSIASKEIDMTALVDPEGYVYVQSSLGETRIANAVVSIYWLNSKTNVYELWPAKNYSQYNPQTTDVTGKYSFLVPPGNYYMTAVKKGFKPYKSDMFTVQAGSAVNQDIVMKENTFNLWSWFIGLFSK